jgi:hypothetical protein
MASSPVLNSAALVAATLLVSACGDLLPGSRPTPPAGVTDSATATPPARPRAAGGARRAATGPEAEAAFREINRSLRALVAAEQGFYAETGTYSEDLQRLGLRPAGASQVEFLWVTKQGWAARGTHPALPGRDCVTWAGEASTTPATRHFGRTGREGVIVCDNTTPPASARPVSPRSSAGPPVARETTGLPDTTSALDAVNPTVQMRVDLRKLGEAQTAYFGTQGVYSRRVETLPLQFGWQRGVKVTLLHADQRSWAARATHTARPGKSCVMWYGSPPTRPSTQAQQKVPERPGVPVCDD